MELNPPIKPPRGVKAPKETSGLLMSVIRTLSASETNEQRDREKSKLESDYKACDKHLDSLVSQHEGDLAKTMNLFATTSQIVVENRMKILRVKESLIDCKHKLTCRRDELQHLWLEGLEYKYMLQILEQIQKINEVSDGFDKYLNNKQYLHATKLLMEAKNLSKNTFDGVESLRDLSEEIAQKTEHLHALLLHEIKDHLYIRPAQRVLALKRQESNRDFTMFDRGKNRDPVPSLKDKLNDGDLPISEEILNAEENSFHYLEMLVQSLALLNKLPSAVLTIKEEMQISLFNVVEKTTQYIKEFALLKVENDSCLEELINIQFAQFKEIAKVNGAFTKYVRKADKEFSLAVKIFDSKFYWNQVQCIFEVFLNECLNIQNVSTLSPVIKQVDLNDLSSYFVKRKQPIKKKSLFKFDGSSSALTMLKSTESEKLQFLHPHSNNILVLFVPFMNFIEFMEEDAGLERGTSQLYRFITNYVSDTYLKQKSDEIMEEIEVTIRSADAWKATVLLDNSSDYKPLLVSVVKVEESIRQWRSVLKALPIYSERIAVYSCKALKEYKETCLAAYQGFVQPDPEDRRIFSATWLKDDDISRFLKSLPNWLNLKAQQEIQARSERTKRGRLNRHNYRSVDEESPEDIRVRNRREAEILASNLGEGNVNSSDIISDMVLIKELAQFQESMEWFSVRMLHFASELRHAPTCQKSDSNNTPVSSGVLHQLTTIAQEFDDLANTCLLLLHLEVRVQCFHYLLLPTQFNKDTHEPDPKVLELSRVLTNVDEAMTSALQPRKCKYIFEGLGHLIAKILISSAQYLQTIDETTIERMCRNIFTLQQTLTNITMIRELSLDHARHYFELFFLTADEILNGIVEKGPEYSEIEYVIALQLLNRSNGGSITTGENYQERLLDILGTVKTNT